MPIDDHSRAGFSRMLADETAKCACAFLLAALRYYKCLGVKAEQVMTDNGAACKPRLFNRLLRRLGIHHIRRALARRGPTARPNDSPRHCCGERACLRTANSRYQRAVH